MSRIADMDLNTLASIFGHRLPPAKNAIPDGYLFGREFKFRVALPDNATTSVDLTLGAVIGSDPEIAKFHGTSDNPDIILQVDACELVIDDAQWPVIDVAEKQDLVQGLQVKFTVKGTTTTYGMSDHVRDPWTDRTLAAADDGGQYVGQGALVLPEPKRIDCARDAFSLEFSENTPNVASAMSAYLRVWGFVVPNSHKDPGGVSMSDYATQHRAAYAALLAKAAEV